MITGLNTRKIAATVNMCVVRARHADKRSGSPSALEVEDDQPVLAKLYRQPWLWTNSLTRFMMSIHHQKTTVARVPTHDVIICNIMNALAALFGG